MFSIIYLTIMVIKNFLGYDGVEVRKNKPTIAPEEVRAIRERLGLTQVEAGELLGGGPRAFTKYEAGTVRPAVAVISLLRLLEADPAALATLGGRKPRPMATSGVRPFEVAGEHVAVLTERMLPQLLRHLLSAEAQAHGLPAAGIHVAASIHTADGGDDGRIEWTGGPDRTPFLPSRLCQFQLKAGSIGPKAAEREVLTKEGTAKDMVRRALELGGCYIMLCGHSYVQRQIEEREHSIRDALRGARLTIDDAQVDFRDADQIAEWANHHPSVATWLKERTQPGTIGPFRSWGHWAGRTEHDGFPWAEDERLHGLRAWLHRQLTEPRSVCRIVGPSGTGKSRLTLEALGPTEKDEAAGHFFSDLVLYAVESETSSETINGVVQTLVDDGQRAIVVVDHCAPESQRILTGMVLRASSRLSLVTIDDEVSTGTPDDTTFKVPEAPSSVTEAIIDQILPGRPYEDRRRLAHFSKGFPKIAVLVGRAWSDSRPIAHAADDDLVEAFILGRGPQERDLLLQSATLLATSGPVRVEHPDGDQLGEIAARGRGLTAADLRAAVQRLIDRDVVRRRGGAVILQPRPIAMRLAERQWREWSREVWDDVLAGDTSPDLKVLAARRLAWINTTEVAPKVVQHVCRIGGPLDSFDGISRTGHAEVVSTLAEVDPKAVAAQIERCLNHVEDHMSVGGDARRHLIWALEKIAFHPDSFENGARLLLRLAIAENETWDNNAPVRFEDLFPMLLGNTAADGNARLSVLDEAAKTDDARQRAIVVEALIAGSWVGHFSRSLGPESHGSRPALESWRPPTNKEAACYVQGCAMRLARFAARADESDTVAQAGLGRNLRGLAGSGFIDAVETVVRQVGAVVGYWPEALEGLGQFLRYDAGKAEQEAVNRVRTLIAELTPRSLESRVRFLVTEMPWDYPYEEALDLETRARRRVEAVRRLAAELIQQPVLLKGFLPQLSRGEQRMAYAFGEAVAGHADSPPVWLEPIIAAVAETPACERNHDLMSGYVAGIAENHPDIVETLKQRAARSPDLAPALPLLCWRLGIASPDIDLAIDALRAGLLPPPALMRWTSGGSLAKVPASSVMPLIDVMLDHGAEAFAVAMGLMVSCAHGIPGKIAGFRPQIRKSVENFTRWRQLRKQQGAVADFELIVHWMLERGREDGDARAAAFALAKALVDDEDYSGEDFIEPMIPVLLSGFPEIVWPLIGQAIVSDQQQAWRLAHVLRGRRSADNEHNPIILSLPEDTLFAWCHAHPDQAPAFAAGVMPVLASSELDASEQSMHPVMVRLLDEFGDREGVLQAVLGNMHTFSWSGSLASYFALYEQPLKALRNHPKPKVRRWATATLRGLAATIKNVHDEEEEREARREV